MSNFFQENKMWYREYEKIGNTKRLVLEIEFRESDGKMKYTSGLIKAGTEPKGGFRNWCKRVAKDIRNYNDIWFDPVNKDQILKPAFGWDESEFIKTNHIIEFSKKHPHVRQHIRGMRTVLNRRLVLSKRCVLAYPHMTLQAIIGESGLAVLLLFIIRMEK